MEGIRFDISISEGIYVKNPLKTDLGKNIIRAAIDLLNDIGFEDFNFKKVAENAGTTEASVYRYFENKYKLLVYLSAWYWDFMLFMVMLDIRNINDPRSQLKQAIATLINSRNSILTPEYIDQTKLHNVMVENATKVFHTKNVDKLNKEGYYANYKKMVKTISEMINKIDHNYNFPIALASTIVEQSLNNEYYIEHLPSLIDAVSSTSNPAMQTIEMINYMIDRLL